MFVFLIAVPVLLVVVLGYVIGHAVWTWLAGMVDAGFGTSLTEGAEIAGWTSGVLLLAGTVRALLVVRRRRAR